MRTWQGGHLGRWVSALIDDQMPAAVAERAWRHVGACPVCADAVRHEAWLKHQLAAGSSTEPSAGLLASLTSLAQRAPGVEDCVAAGNGDRSSAALTTPTQAWAAPPVQHSGLLVFAGAGSAAAALVGALALGAVGAAAPTQLARQAPSSVPAQASPLTSISGALGQVRSGTAQPVAAGRPAAMVAPLTYRAWFDHQSAPGAQRSAAVSGVPWALATAHPEAAAGPSRAAALNPWLSRWQPPSEPSESEQGVVSVAWK